jgi:TonB family protein
MTLVEALTQRVPLSEGTGAELILPETIPEPFFDIANHCLRRDPQHRWTITEISARLQRTPPVSVEEEIPETRGWFPRWGYVAGVVALGVLLWGILKPTSPTRPGNVEPAATTAAESSKPPSEPAPEAPTSQSAQAPVATKRPPGEPPSGVPQVAAGNSGAKNPTTGSVRGEVAHQVSPDVSKNARNTIHGKVKVKVRVMVDSSGSVVVAKFDSRGPSKYFAERALEAGRQWVFKPPQVDGQGVPSEWILKFEFARNATNIHSEQTSP